jgi:hypothetical protein
VQQASRLQRLHQARPAEAEGAAAALSHTTTAAAAGSSLPDALSVYVCSVIKVILQFCKENGLTESFSALQVSQACIDSTPVATAATAWHLQHTTTAEKRE